MFVRYAPPESAIVRIRQEPDPDAWVTGEVQLLREIEHQLRVLAWMRTEDATKHPSLQRNFPDRIPLTTAERAEAEEKNRPEYDPMTLDEAAEFLGWTRPEPKEA